VRQAAPSRARVAAVPTATDARGRAATTAK
jgi:hypothetical protein